MISGFRPAASRFLSRSRTYTWNLRIYQVSRCDYHTDGRSRASNVWMPTKHISKKTEDGQTGDVNDLLIKGGFYRKAYAGIFHMLPLGLRVQEKLERLIDRHMQSLGASKVSLSSISSQELWEKSGRLKDNSEVRCALMVRHCY
jgi:prolyl-tRNA synthetase